MDLRSASKASSLSAIPAAALSLTFSFLIALLITGVTFAREIPIELKSRFLRYNEADKTMVATGEVEIKVEDLKIRTEKIYLSTKTEMATSEGTVELLSSQYLATSEGLSYDAQKKVTRVKNFRAQFTPKDIKGKVYVRADRFTDSQKHQEGRQGSSTTCDYGEPHYHISSARFEHYPEDKIVGVHNILWIGPVPILYLPYYSYSIKKKQAPSLQFGETQVEGRFVKTSLDYFLGAAAAGILYLDLFEKKGFGKGFQHDYSLSNTQKGTWTLYQIRETDTNTDDWVSKLSHTITFPQSTEANVQYNLRDIYALPTGRLDDRETKISLNRRGEPWPYQLSLSTFDNRFSEFETDTAQFSLSPPGHSLSYSGNLNRNRRSPRNVFFQEQVSWNGPLLWPSSYFRFSTSHTQNQFREGAPIDERLFPRLGLSFYQPTYGVNVSLSKFFRLRADQFPTSSSDEFYEEVPLVTVTGNPISTRLATITPRLEWGSFNEAKFFSSLSRVRNFQTGRWQVGTTLSRSDPLPGNSRLNSSLDLAQFLYDPGDARYSLTENIRLDTQPHPVFSNSIDYRRGFADGNSPFYFDSFSSLFEDIRDQMDFIFGPVARFTLSGGYNYRSNRSLDLTGTLKLTPAKEFSSTIQTAYNFDEKRYRDLNVGATLIPIPDMSVTANLVQDLNQGQLRGANSLLVYELAPDEWHEHTRFKIGHVYDPAAQEFKMRDLEIIKDLHCWELKYTYSDFRKESNYLFVLKAFPTSPIGVGSTRGFYFEGMEDALKSKGPQRY